MVDTSRVGSFQKGFHFCLFFTLLVSNNYVKPIPMIHRAYVVKKKKIASKACRL